MPFEFHVSGVGVNFGLRMLRVASSANPRIIRAPIWSEHAAHTPVTLNEPTAKNRRRETLLFIFFNSFPELAQPFNHYRFRL